MSKCGYHQYISRVARASDMLPTCYHNCTDDHDFVNSDIDKLEINDYITLRLSQVSTLL